MVDRLVGLSGLKKPQTQARPPRARRMTTLYPTGPRAIGLERPVRRIVGPGDPPEGFVRATTSASEWRLYWALAKVFNDPVDPRRAPFFGGRDWGYQLALLGQFAFQQGSAVLDFLVYLPQERIGIRLVTRYWHIAQSPQVKASDLAQKIRLELGDVRVVEVYEDDILSAPDGSDAILAAKRALGMWEAVDPFRTARSFVRG
jgi:hypothetical protein